jgi:AraC-like DNA-binding protein
MSPRKLALLNEVPEFGDQLYSAGAMDLHAAVVVLPNGGAGSFNHTEPSISYLDEGVVWLSMDGFSGWVEGGSLLVLPSGVRRFSALSHTRAISLGLGADGLAGRYAVQPHIVRLGRRDRSAWRDRTMALVESPQIDRGELTAALIPVLVDAAERRERRRCGLISRFLELVEKSADLSLHEIGEHFGYAPNHFNAIIRHATDRSIRQWEIGFRLESARRLLKSSHITVTEVAARVGLQAPYFARSFRERYHLAPSAWRAMVLRGTNFVPMTQDVNAGGVVSIADGTAIVSGRSSP